MAAATDSQSDLVRDSRLDTIFINATTTRHIFVRSDRRAGQRQVRVEESWQRQRQLGNGTFGKVWLESCVGGPNTGQLRAIKEVAKGGDETAVDYRRELDAIAKFSHDKYRACFIHSDGWFENDTAVFISMEYLEHGDLQRYLTRPFPEPEAQHIASQLAEGLAFMHANGFAHRDLKPANILVVEHRPSWWVKIGDFGISKRTFGTSLRTFAGTRGYLAPEMMFSSDVSCDVAVDIWAFGQIVHLMLTQKLAFSGGATGDFFKFVTGAEGFPWSPLVDANASPECRALVQKALAASPAERLSADQLLSHSWIATAAAVPSESAPSGDKDMLVSEMTDLLDLEDEFGTVNQSPGSAAWTTVVAARSLVPSAGLSPDLQSSIPVVVGISITSSSVKAAWLMKGEPVEPRRIRFPSGRRRLKAVPPRISYRQDGTIGGWGYGVDSEDPWHTYCAVELEDLTAESRLLLAGREPEEPLLDFFSCLYGHILLEIRSTLSQERNWSHHPTLLVDCVFVAENRPHDGQQSLLVRSTLGWRARETPPQTVRVVGRNEAQSVHCVHLFREVIKSGQAFTAVYLHMGKRDLTAETIEVSQWEPLRIQSAPGCNRAKPRLLPGLAAADLVRSKLPGDFSQDIDRLAWRQFEKDLTDRLLPTTPGNYGFDIRSSLPSPDSREYQARTFTLTAGELKTAVLEPMMKKILGFIKAQWRHSTIHVPTVLVAGGEWATGYQQLWLREELGDDVEVHAVPIWVVSCVGAALYGLLDAETRMSQS